MMKIILIFWCGFFLVSSGNLFSQQLPQYSQYMVNNFIMNPAVGGISSDIDIKVGYRKQWVGFDGAPTTQFVSVNSAINKINGRHYRIRRKRPHQGIGGYMIKDETGPLSKFGIYGNYAYHLPLSKKYYLSAGIFLGILQNRLDLNKVTLSNPNDPSVFAAAATKLSPDGAFGFWLYSERFFTGFSINQIFQTRMFSINENNSIITSKLFNHYFFHIGYNIPYNEDWNIVPSVLYKSVRPVFLQFDLNLKVWYRKKIWGAVSYRLQDAISFVTGFTPNKKLEISYSYDLTTSKIQKYSSGVHEIILGFRIGEKDEIWCPEKFW